MVFNEQLKGCEKVVKKVEIARETLVYRNKKKIKIKNKKI